MDRLDKSIASIQDALADLRCDIQDVFVQDDMQQSIVTADSIALLLPECTNRDHLAGMIFLGLKKIHQVFPSAWNDITDYADFFTTTYNITAGFTNFSFIKTPDSTYHDCKPCRPPNMTYGQKDTDIARGAIPILEPEEFNAFVTWLKELMEKNDRAKVILLSQPDPIDSYASLSYFPRCLWAAAWKWKRQREGICNKPLIASYIDTPVSRLTYAQTLLALWSPTFIEMAKSIHLDVWWWLHNLDSTAEVTHTLTTNLMHRARSMHLFPTE